MASINLDFVFQTDVERDAKAYGARFGIDQVEVITENGPAGGWPVVQFTGTDASIAQLCAAYYGDSETFE